MKNYFAIAALLGVFAFASVSFLAQAQQPDEAGVTAEKAAINAADPSDGEAASDMAEDVEEAPEPQSKDDVMEEAHNDCMGSAEAVKGVGDEPTEAEISAAYTKCMKKNKYTDAQIKAYENGETLK